MTRHCANWLEAHARFRPDAEAIYDVDAGRRWTYGQLYEESLRWAGFLFDRRVRHGDRVALLCHSRAEVFALLFACAELGAVLQPMSWRLSPAELAWQVQHSQPRVVLADADHLHLLPGAELLDEPGHLSLHGLGAELEDPWLLLYTSGTTGRPKGALLPHRQLHFNAMNTVLACELIPDDATLTFTPLFHTGGMNSLSTPLLHRGGRVVLTRRVVPAQALSLIASEGVALLMGVPTIYQALSEHPSFAEADLSSVRDAICGGAPLSAALLEQWHDRGVPLRQGFGLTEVGPNCFSMPPDQARHRLDSIGLPIHHLGLRLVRPDGTDCEEDEPGELWLSGPPVFHGYLGEEPHQGWFRTGDVLSRDAQGFCRVVGRLKEMFISGGENVYPAEVEAALHRCVGVALAAVVGIPHPRWGEVGRAFVQAEPGVALDPEAVLAELRGHLARFKIPKELVVLEQLPLNMAGKVDKVSLSQWEPA